MSEGYVHLELDCVSGEKIIIHRSETPGALAEVKILSGRQELLKVQVKPESLLLALGALQLTVD